VSAFARWMFVSASAVAVTAQTVETDIASTIHRPLLDASNQEFTSREDVVHTEGRQLGSVSAQQLEAQLSGKAKKLISNAEKLLRDGDHAKALQLLDDAAKDRGAMPYAYSIRGAEYLRSGELEKARADLDIAAALLPGYAPNHYHLALALSRLGHAQEALVPAQKAVQLDPVRSDYRYVLGVVLWMTGKKDEGLFHLKMAAAGVPAAAQLLKEAGH
jgi:tetratricopeptide (TPR) repeat protein